MAATDQQVQTFVKKDAARQWVRDNLSRIEALCEGAIAGGEVDRATLAASFAVEA